MSRMRRKYRFSMIFGDVIIAGALAHSDRLSLSKDAESITEIHGKITKHDSKAMESGLF